ncbi:LPXTG cell wall anchor domain-containing protein [Listeria monocytogenes]|nr:LPXTG cell wall anchor domain-containing protein [Listeria monocytogenes]
MCTIGLPIQNIVLANEVATNESVVTEEAEINEDKTIVSEENEQPTEENIQEEKEISEEATSAVTATVSSEQQLEEITDSKEEVEVKESNQPVEVERTIKKDVKAISPDKISSIFPDATLAEVIRDTLGKSSIDDIVTQAELDIIRRLQIVGCSLSLSGMENLTNLGFLDLEDNQISDISPLSNLTNLSNLWIDNNQISDISPLSNLTNLSSLDLNNNQISDISPLSNLTNLRWLGLEDQKISASKVKWNDPLSVTNAIKDNNGNLIAPSSISNQGAYTNPTITWTGLTNTPQSVSYSWSQSVTIGASTTTFNGTFTLPVEKSAQYNLFFDIDRQVTTELVEAGELVTKPQDPNKDGYAFIGWYDTETGGNKWDFSTDTMPANDMTLYARFNKLGFVTPEIKPSTPGSGGNQPPSNGSGSNTGNMTITSQENTVTSSPEASEQSKLAQLGEQNSMILQGFGLLMVISGIAFFWWKRRKKVHS